MQHQGYLLSFLIPMAFRESNDGFSPFVLVFPWVSLSQFLPFVQSGWKESQRVFNEQLKGLRAKGVANFEQSVESVMRLLTINRMQTGAGAGIENYGFGRFPR